MFQSAPSIKYPWPIPFFLNTRSNLWELNRLTGVSDAYVEEDITAWYSSLRHWSSCDDLVDTLHDGHMERLPCWKTPILEEGTLYILEEGFMP